jgi:putative nucleotidyltransferase with HDIG domain
LTIPLVDVLDTMLDALGTRRPAVAAHCRRVSAYAVQLATQYGLAEELVESIRVGGLLHDVGKLQIPPNILSKPGRLTEKEWHTLQSHSEQGFEMLRPLAFDETVLDIVLYHHERHDSSGYPDGLTGDAIPFAVRIVSVMDAFDALTSPRTYREALSVEAARTLLARESVDRYCPWVVSGLLSLPRAGLDAVARGSNDSYRPDARPSVAVLRSATTPWVAGHVENPGHVTAW